jgi:hypothetical protein
MELIVNYIDKILEAGFKFKNPQSKYWSIQKYDLVCPNGHNIFVRLSNLANRVDARTSKGCAECRTLEQDDESLKTTLGHLPKGFKIIGSYRKKTNRKEQKSARIYQFECDHEQKHKFEKESGHLSGLSCPTCNGPIHIGQERTREIFQQVFNVKFKSIRPNWLNNPKTNVNLELDGYNKDLNLAFEFQGNQHTSPNTQFGNEHYAQVERDELKRQLCKKLGVTLIEIHQPPQYAENKFIKHVLEQIKKQINPLDYPNINFNNDNVNFDNLKFNGLPLAVKDFLDYLQNEPNAEGYSCITNDFHTNDDKINMCCPEGHDYETTPAEFKRNVEGKKGRRIPCITCYEATGESKTIIDLAYCREEGKKHGLELLSTDYKNVGDELEWKDANGKTIKLAFRKLQRRKLVKKPNTRGIDIAYCREKGKEFGLELLSTKYTGVNDELEWKDVNGKTIKLDLRKLQRRKQVKKSNTKGIDVDFCRNEGRKYGLELLSTEYKNVYEKLLWKKQNGDEIELHLRQIQRSKTGIF